MFKTKAKFKEDLFEGSLTKNILLYALPIMATGILQLLFNTADLVVVGRYDGPNALAAVGSTSALINLIVNLLLGLSVGAAVSVAQAWGAKDKEALEKNVHTAMAVALVGGIIVGVAGFFLGETFLEMMKTDSNVIEGATTYIKIYFIGVPASMVYNFGAAILRSVGDAKRPLFFLALSGVTNMVLNIVFVAGFDLGVAGVAIATAISQLVAAVLVVIHLMRSNESYKLVIRKIGFHKSQFFTIIRIGVPAGLQSSIFSISNVIIQSSVNGFGNIAVAGNTAAMSIEGFVYTVMNAFGQSAMTFTGQTVGARRNDRIPAIGLRCALLVTVVGLAAGIAAYIFRSPLLHIFMPAGSEDTAQAVEYGSIRVFIICVPYFLCGLMDCFTGMLRGMGRSALPMVVCLVGVCGIRIIWICTFFAANPTLEMIYYSYPVSWLITALAQWIMYMSAKSKALRRGNEEISHDNSAAEQGKLNA